MNCVTGKRPYDSQAQAEEALVDTRARFVFRENSGPLNVYQCDDCGFWHFTSKGERHPLLDDEDTNKKIKKEQEAEYWKRRFGFH